MFECYVNEDGDMLMILESYIVLAYAKNKQMLYDHIRPIGDSSFAFADGYLVYNNGSYIFSSYGYFGYYKSGFVEIDIENWTWHKVSQIYSISGELRYSLNVFDDDWKLCLYQLKNNEL